VLRRIFEAKTEEVTGASERAHNEDADNFRSCYFEAVEEYAGQCSMNEEFTNYFSLQTSGEETTWEVQEYIQG
jgi:hypothetical protein